MNTGCSHTKKSVNMYVHVCVFCIRAGFDTFVTLNKNCNIFWKISKSEYFMENLKISIFYEKFKNLDILWKISKLQYFMKNLKISIFYEQSQNFNIFWKISKSQYFLKISKSQKNYEKSQPKNIFEKSRLKNMFEKSRLKNILSQKYVWNFESKIFLKNASFFLNVPRFMFPGDCDHPPKIIFSNTALRAQNVIRRHTTLCHNKNCMPHRLGNFLTKQPT